ncbi:MAG: cobalamin biosynthesis protein CobD [Deltaproteobacteria bacterium]|nr:cobalamin biosynthesis protein CobD [Deltaproteobacteria bacterium]
MALEYQIISALILDALIGDPRWLPHPVRFIGWLAIVTEKGCRHLISHERLAGVAAVFIVLTVTGAAGWLVIRAASFFHPLAGDAVAVLLLSFCFAARDLAGHSRAVRQALETGDIGLARQKVAMMVGRDTGDLDEPGIIRACVESVAENMVDGVTAPLFYAVLAGPVGALLYKGVNTLDSLFGYKNERYLRFGWGAARLDDAANFLPARLTGLLTVAAAFLLGLNGRLAWRIFRRDRLRHASPNSGHTEAATAGALGLRLGGLSCYQGREVDKPFIGDAGAPPQPRHITRANRLLAATTVLAALFMLTIRVVLLP